MFLKKTRLLRSFACLFLLANTAPAQNAWIDSDRFGDEARFLSSSQILRYDLGSKSWLPPANLPRSGATAMAADADGAVVAYGASIYRYEPNFGGESLVGTANSSVHSIFLDGNFVIAVHSQGSQARVTIFDRATAEQISTISGWSRSIYGASHAPGSRRIYGGTQGISPPSITTLSYDADGILSPVQSIRHHAANPNGPQTWLFPDETRVTNTSGTVYATPGLTYTASFGGAFIDIDFNGDLPIVLRQGELLAFTTNLLEAGKTTVSTTADSKLHIAGSDALVFTPGSGAPGVQIVPLSSINAPEPGTPVDPDGLAFTIDDVFLDRNGNLLMFSKSQLSLFRWSPADRQYTGSFALRGVPDYAAYSAENHSTYFAYATQQIRAMAMDADSPQEVHFQTLPQRPSGIATAGEFVLAVDPSGAWNTHYVFSPLGELLDSEDWNRRSSVFDWDPVQRRMYFFRDGTSPNDLHYETINTDGRITGKGDTPYHGSFAATPPIRVSPDGGRVVIGSGIIFETAGLTIDANLANGFTDAAWIGNDQLVTLREIGGVSQLQVWQGSQFLPTGTVRQFEGTPVRVFDTSEGVLVITSANGTPRMILLDGGFEPVFFSPLMPDAPTSPVVTGRTIDSISLQWSDPTGNAKSFRVEFRTDAGAWTEAATTPDTTATISGLPANTNHDIRVVAIAGTLVSEPSPTVSTRTLASPDEPIGEPYHLRITRIFSNSMSVEWQDNGNNETGFQLMRSTEPEGPFNTITLPAGATSHTQTRLRPDTTYYFQVRIVNSDVLGEISSQVSATTMAVESVPAMSTSIQVNDFTATSVTLKWQDVSQNENGFIIERSGGSTSGWQSLGTVPHNTETFTDTTVEPGTWYTYRVAAFNGVGTSIFRSTTVDTPKLSGEFTGLAMRSGNVKYLAFNGPDRIERYDLDARAWLEPILLEATATALWVDDSWIFAAENRLVVRFSLDGGGRTPMAGAQSTVRQLFTLHDTLVFNTTNRLRMTMDKHSGIFLSTFNYNTDGAGISVAPGLNRAFFRSTSVSPSSIYHLTFNASGDFITGERAPHSGTYPNATRTFVFPDGTRVADNSGTVYATDSLIHNNSFGGAFTDLAFHGRDVPIILRDDELHAYSNTLLPVGSLTLPEPGLRLAVSGNDALVFMEDTASPNGLRVETVPLSQIGAPEPGAAIDPNGLAFDIDGAFMDRDGDLLLFNKSQLSVFRWSPSARAYTGSYPLVGVPEYAAYSAENHRMYFAYATQLIRAMNLDAPAPAEVPFFNLPARPNGIATAGEFILAVDPAGAWNTHYVISPDGELLDSVDWNHRSRVFDWDPVKRRMYFFRDSSIPRDLHYEVIDANGRITGKGETPYHGTFSVVPPIRVSPDGGKVVIGSGVVFETGGLTIAANLTNGFTDGIWTSDERFVTLREIGGVSQLQVWHGPQLLPDGTVRQFEGAPLHVFDTPEGLLVITSVRDTPRMILLDEDFEPVFVSPLRPDAPAAPIVTGRTMDSISLQWNDPSGKVDTFRLEYRSSPDEWAEAIATTATGATLTGLPAKTKYEFRLVGIAEGLASAPSPVVTTRTLGSPDEPVGEPYNLRITRIFSDSMTVEWQDNGDNETGFQVLWATAPDGPFNVVNLPAGSTSHTQAQLSPNRAHYFQVRIVNGDVLGELSAQVSATTRSSDWTPIFSSALHVADLSPTSVTLRWADASTNEDGFVIERSTSPVSTWTPLGTVPYNTETFTDATAEPDTRYTYRVAAFNQFGNSNFRMVTVTTPPLGGEFTGLAMRSENIKYFAFDGPHRIERYDLYARLWLPPIPLEATTTALWVDESWIFVAKDRLVVRYAKDGTGRIPMGGAQHTIHAVFTLGDTLVFNSTNRERLTMDKNTGNFLGGFEYWRDGRGVSVAPDLNRAYFRSTGVSPSDIHFLQFDESGNFVSGDRSPYHGNYPNAARTFMFPDGKRVADDSGTVYSTDGLIFSNSLGGSFIDLAFYGMDIPIALRADGLHSFTNTLLPAGSYALTTPGLRVAVDGDDALVFSRDAISPNGLRVEAVPLSEIGAPEPGNPVDPNGLAFAIDEAFVDRDGNLLFFNKSNLSLFRWSPSAREYTGSFALAGAPGYAAYSADNHSMYFAYGSQIIRAMDLDVPAPTEVPLFTQPRPPSGIATAGEFILAVDPSGAWNTHYVISPEGELLDSEDWNRRSSVFAWDPVKRRMYFFRDGTSPNDLHYETIDTNGRITGKGDTPYHGQFTIAPPIRVSPDGSKVIIGSGIAFETAGLTRIGAEIPAFADALWHGTSLFTIHASGTRTQVVRRNPETLATLSALATVPGTPVRMLSLKDGHIALVTLEKGVPRIQIYNASLTLIHTFISAPSATENVPFSWTPEFDWSGLGSGQLTIQATVLPDWLTFADGTLSGTPRSGDAGDLVDRSRSHRVVLRATNTSGGHEEREFQITAHWRNNPPTLPPSLPAILANDRADDIRFDVGPSLTDPDGRDFHIWEILEHTVPEIFSTLAISDDGALDIAFAPYVSGKSIVTLQVTDASGATAQTTVEVILPEIPAPQLTVESEPILSRLTGLFEQRVTVTNVGQRAIAGFELSITELREGVTLYNGSSDGDGGGIISHHQPLQAGESVSMVLEYFATPRGTIPTPVISASIASSAAIQAVVRREDAALPFDINRFVKQADGSMVIEFNAIPGEQYVVHYSADAANWTPCPLPIQAGGTKVQWIDRGPPWTTSHPSSAPRRFYRVQHVAP